MYHGPALCPFRAWRRLFFLGIQPHACGAHSSTIEIDTCAFYFFIFANFACRQSVLVNLYVSVVFGGRRAVRNVIGFPSLPALTPKHGRPTLEKDYVILTELQAPR